MVSFETQQTRTTFLFKVKECLQLEGAETIITLIPILEKELMHFTLGLNSSGKFHRRDVFDRAMKILVLYKRGFEVFKKDWHHGIRRVRIPDLYHKITV